MIPTRNETFLKEILQNNKKSHPSIVDFTLVQLNGFKMLNVCKIYAGIANMYVIQTIKF